MTLADDKMRGLVYKSDSQKDLALVKLATSARGSHNLAALALAVALPKVSSDCVAIGHPSSGHLWSVRNGVIAGTGNWPRDHIDWTMEKLRLTSDTARRELEELVKRLPQRKVILSTCGINHGDSGGPLVDAKGDLIGVTFGIPAAVEDNKFAYHIHLDEVRNFLKDVTATPPLHVPSPWPPSALGAIHDLDGDGTQETLVLGMPGSALPTGSSSTSIRRAHPTSRASNWRSPPRTRPGTSSSLIIGCLNSPANSPWNAPSTTRITTARST